LSESLFFGLASRFEYYDDFGNNLSWKAYGRYRLNPNLVLKSSFNTGFRAPSMPQTFFNNFTFQVIDSPSGQIGVNVGQFNNESVTARLFGFEPLKAETSANLNIGLAAKISKALSFSIDAFNIDINDRIVLSSRLSEDDDPRFIPILEANDVFYAQFFTNAIDTRTRGIDVELHHQSNIGRANLKLSILANFIETKVRADENGNKIIKTSNALSNVKDVLFNREEISRFEFVQPASKLIFNANVKFKKWMLNWRATRFGKVTYIHPADGNPDNWVLNNYTNQVESRDQVFSAKIINDLNLQYYFSNKLYISIGGQNILNQYPDQHSHSANTFNGIFTYSRRVQQFGVRGAYWYSSISVSL
jgi:iron complex outermembrane receptor protein